MVSVEDIDEDEVNELRVVEKGIVDIDEVNDVRKVNNVRVRRVLLIFFVNG